MQWVTVNKKPYSHNASFSYSQGSFDINMTKFKYSLSLVSKGASQARQRYTMYPNRVEQSNLSLEVIFRDPEEYAKFGAFVKQYHLYQTSRANPDPLVFKSDAIRGGVRYSVAITSLPMNFDYRMVAPSFTLDLLILKDELDTGYVGDSNNSGSMGDLIGDQVNAGDIANSGDNAFTKDPNRFDGGATTGSRR